MYPPNASKTGFLGPATPEGLLVKQLILPLFHAVELEARSQINNTHTGLYRVPNIKAGHRFRAVAIG